MASTIDDFIATICPLLNSSISKDIYVEMAKMTLNADVLAENYALAVALRAAHEYTIDATRPMGSGGVIVGQSEGRASIQFAEPSRKVSLMSNLSATQYGQRLKALIRSMGLVATSSGDANALPGAF